MSDVARLVAQIDAHRRRRAVTVRATSSLSRDPARLFGIAPIRVVAEQRVQAIAFGEFAHAPQIVTIWNPLSRDTGQLEPFATALNTYLSGTAEPRVWLPHGAALEIIDLLGHRYATNQNASVSLRRLGAQCRVLADEATYAGQQVVAVASDLLIDHVATGQSPVEDRHLGALLAWIKPTPNVDAAVDAARRALLPAAAMLPRVDDDRVEDLRRIAKGSGGRADAARGEIERLLLAGAAAEWRLLVEARDAFWGLQLPLMSGVGNLQSASYARFGYAIQALHSRPVMPHTLSALLDAQEHALDVEENVSVRSDNTVLERLRRRGKAIRVVLVERLQRSRGRKPCVLMLYTRQDILRVREGTTLQTLDQGIVGRVVSVRSTPDRAGTFIALTVQHGVRAAGALRRMTRFDLSDAVVVDMSVRKGQAYRRLQAEQPAIVYGDALPPAMPRVLPETPLDAVAEKLRKA